MSENGLVEKGENPTLRHKQKVQTDESLTASTLVHNPQVSESTDNPSHDPNTLSSVLLVQN